MEHRRPPEGKDDVKWEVYHKEIDIDEDSQHSSHTISMSTAYRYLIKLGWLCVKLKPGIFMGEDLETLPEPTRSVLFRYHRCT